MSLLGIVAARALRTTCAVALGVVVTTGNLFAASASSTRSAPAEESLGNLGQLDLMEAGFRAGLALYEAGDHAAAVRAWLAPAEHGHMHAQFSLGVAHATGKGAAQDIRRALHWWHAAAQQGHVGAQLNLGLLYWRGDGVEKDLAKAREWWARAAQGGDAAAQFHLGALAATGEGEPRNYKEALRWWRLSAAQGYSQAIKGLEILRAHGALDD